MAEWTRSKVMEVFLTFTGCIGMIWMDDVSNDVPGFNSTRIIEWRFGHALPRLLLIEPRYHGGQAGEEGKEEGRRGTIDRECLMNLVASGNSPLESWWSKEVALNSPPHVERKLSTHDSRSPLLSPWHLLSSYSLHHVHHNWGPGTHLCWRHCHYTLQNQWRSCEP